MTKEEIVNKITCNGMREMTNERILQAMDEYGKQCFDAGRTHVFGDYERPKYENYEDYLKELENETTSIH